MSNARTALARLRELDSEAIRLEQVAEVLEWDQETYLPTGAVEDRAAQVALIRGIRHERIVGPEWGELFDRLECDAAGICKSLGGIDAALVREAHRRWTRQAGVPKRLVEELAQAASISQAAWAGARSADNFTEFRPHLEKVLALKKEYAQAISTDLEEYDALLDEFEPGSRGESVAAVFDGLSEGLSSLLDRIKGTAPPRSDFLKSSYSIEAQHRFGRRIQEHIGYDYNRGRLDLSAHPFTATLGPNDVRVTTRYSEEMVLSGLYSNIHEAGHGLYEQGMGPELRNTLLAEAASLGIHESQSRFWENVVGRSAAFWKKWYPEFQRLFPDQLRDVREEDFYRAANLVLPTLIRVDADEVSYGFHVIIRFRLERALLRGDLSVSELPEAWRTAYDKLLGIVPKSDSEGCMQDIHWATGLFGYFPTYALGNLYSSQFADAMERDLGALDELIAGDGVDQILGWLRRNIHVHGRVHSPEDLCTKVTGKPLDPCFFLSYLRKKYSDIYGIRP